MDLLELVRLILGGHGLNARQWIQDANRTDLDWSTIPEPLGATGRELIVGAALVEMFADRAGKTYPEWTSRVGESALPIWLVRNDLLRFTQRVLEETPKPLRSRNVFAPSDFLRLS